MYFLGCHYYSVTDDIIEQNITWFLCYHGTGTDIIKPYIDRLPPKKTRT